jgi:hypothetical protein
MLERLTASAKRPVAKFLVPDWGIYPTTLCCSRDYISQSGTKNLASVFEPSISDTGKSDGRQMLQCGMKYLRKPEIKSPFKKRRKNNGV